jgi:tetratricopeptide (TPR) repeat protein
MPPDDDFTTAWQHHQAGDLRRAERGYRNVLRAEPRHVRAWFALAQLCDADRRPAEAFACYRQALEIAPHEAEGHFLLGNSFLNNARFADAEAPYRRCLKLRPDHLAARVNLGFVLGELNRLDEARVCYEETLRRKPDQAEAHHNLANLSREQGRYDEALAGYGESLRLRPDYAKALINRGIALVAMGRLDEAVADLERGLALQPDLADAHTSLGVALSLLRRFDEAHACHERALALAPEFAEANWNSSLLWLLQGDFARGWPAYEWRWRCKKIVPLPAFDRPRWDGSDLAGKTILLYAEQGLGDTLQFIRYATLLKERGACVIVQCQNALLRLLSRTPGVDGLLGWGTAPPPYDTWAPLMSLPALTGSMPATVPYVFPDRLHVARWREELARVRGYRVGIAWQGSPRHPWDRHRSVPLEQFEPLAWVEGVRLISLQKNHGSEQLRALAGRFPVDDLGGALDEIAGPFADTSAVLANLDLVVCVDSAIAHLAGAMGVPCWVVLARTPDWRWLLDRPDSPWYPNTRLFRQTHMGDWSGVFEEMAEELRRRDAAPRSRPIRVEISPGELLDKLTILKIKSARIGDEAKLRNVRAELEELQAAREESLPATPELADLEASLQAVNETLWRIEDDLRRCEAGQEFGPAFVELARSVYRENDRRGTLKRAINALLGSRLVEEKSYEGRPVG